MNAETPRRSEEGDQNAGEERERLSSFEQFFFFSPRLGVSAFILLSFLAFPPWRSWRLGVHSFL